MKFTFFRDIKKRNLFKKFETKRKLFFFFLNSLYLSIKIREYIFNLGVQIYPRYSSKASFKNRCYLNNMSSSIRLANSGQTVLSRHELRRIISFGGLFPYRRSSW